MSPNPTSSRRVARWRRYIAAAGVMLTAGAVSQVGANTGPPEPVVAAILGTTKAVQATTTSVDAVKASTDATAALVASQNALQITANTLANSANAFLNGMNGLLSQLVSLNNTSKDTLKELRDQYAVTPNTFSVSGTNWQDNMNDALNRIAAYSFATSVNTYHILHRGAGIGDQGGEGAYGFLPSHGAGGWIGGQSHANGGTIIEAERGEFMMQHRYAKIWGPQLEDMNAGRMPALPSPLLVGGGGNDSAAVIAELRRGYKELRDEVRALRSENAMGHAQTARTVQRADQNNIENRTEQTTLSNRELRFTERMAKAKTGRRG